MPSNEPNRPWRSWYSSKEWFRLRHKAMQRDADKATGVPRCQKTGVLLTGPRHAPNSPVVDHIKPHRGDPRLFFNLDNLMTVSKLWHDQTKQRIDKGRLTQIGEDGFPIIGEGSKAWRDNLFEPRDLLPSKPDLVIVCGAPASGKSTYVRNLAAPDDVIVDMDLEADRLGICRFTTHRPAVLKLLAARNERLRNLSKSDASRAWFTMTAAKAEKRELFASQLKPVDVVVMFTPLQECLRRIADSRPNAPEAMLKAVTAWHTDYRPRQGETVIDYK